MRYHSTFTPHRTTQWFIGSRSPDNYYCCSWTINRGTITRNDRYSRDQLFAADIYLRGELYVNPFVLLNVLQRLAVFLVRADYRTGTVGRCLLPTTSKGPTLSRGSMLK